VAAGILPAECVCQAELAVVVSTSLEPGFSGQDARCHWWWCW
jgi:hypothetical protein